MLIELNYYKDMLLYPVLQDFNNNWHPAGTRKFLSAYLPSE